MSIGTETERSHSFALFLCTISPNIFSLPTAYISCNQEQKKDYFNVCEAEVEEVYLEQKYFRIKKKKLKDTYFNLSVTSM